MNIFYLDKDPVKSAHMLIDKHVVKMVLESAQLLSTCHRVLDGEHGYKVSPAGRKLQIWTHPDPIMEKTLYKASHFNHPCSVWLRESTEHYEWLYKHFKALSDEYTKRYGKIHLSWTKLGELLAVPPWNIELTPFKEPPQAMPTKYQIKGDSLKSYYNYYITEKLIIGTIKDKERFYRLIKGEWINE